MRFLTKSWIFLKRFLRSYEKRIVAPANILFRLYTDGYMINIVVVVQCNSFWHYVFRLLGTFPDVHGGSNDTTCTSIFFISFLLESVQMNSESVGNSCSQPSKRNKICVGLFLLLLKQLCTSRIDELRQIALSSNFLRYNPSHESRTHVWDMRHKVVSSVSPYVTPCSLRTLHWLDSHRLTLVLLAKCWKMLRGLRRSCV